MANAKQQGLTYYLPAPDKPHTRLKIPGSFTLYVGPSSCMRRHAIRSFERQAEAYKDTKACEDKCASCEVQTRIKENDVAFLHVTESDVISGRYEDLIVESIGSLLQNVVPKPRIFIIAVFCIDDFLGTDNQALIALLEATYPGYQFAFDHIDPVTLSSAHNMSQRKNSNLYSFILPPEQKDQGVTFLGNFVSLDSDCEFLTLLKKWGASEIRELFRCSTYGQYQDLGKSQLSIVLRFMGAQAARLLEERTGMPFFEYKAGYDAHEISASYCEIARLLGANEKPFEREIAQAYEDAQATVAHLRGIPIALDSSASLMTFATAKALCNYGFNVRYLFRSNHNFKLDEEAEAYILNNHPEITVTRAEDVEHIATRKLDHECLAIGADAARVLRAKHFADMWHDEGYFGFQGVHKLFALMREAYDAEVNWDTLPDLAMGKKKRQGSLLQDKGRRD